MLSWIYSFYCWEFRWSLNGQTIHKQRKVLETNWAYYCGFGLTFTCLTVYFPGLFSYGIWALLFPVFLLTSITAECPEVGENAFRLPIFYLPSIVTAQIEAYLGTKATKKSP
jgi:etoposide-induced 2.4 mRNA